MSASAVACYATPSSAMPSLAWLKRSQSLFFPAPAVLKGVCTRVQIVRNCEHKSPLYMAVAETARVVQLVCPPLRGCSGAFAMAVWPTVVAQVTQHASAFTPNQQSEVNRWRLVAAVSHCAEPAHSMRSDGMGTCDTSMADENSEAAEATVAVLSQKPENDAVPAVTGHRMHFQSASASAVPKALESAPPTACSGCGSKCGFAKARPTSISVAS